MDIDGRRLGVRYPVEVPLLGDAREALAALLPLIRPKRDPAWRQRIEAGVERWRSIVAQRVADPAVPLLPPSRPFEKVKQMYEGLAQEKTAVGRRALAHLRRERASEGYDDPAG